MNYTNLFEILKKLISFPSITPQSAGSIEYIEEILQRYNFDCTKKIFGDKNYKVTNLYAQYGVGEPHICFAGHVDVVHPINISMWKNKNPFCYYKEDNTIYGRGIVDMKGSIAAFLYSIITLMDQKKIKGTISVLLTSDEEGDGIYGTPKMLNFLSENQKPKIDFCILGEPTSYKYVGDTIKIGRRGSMNYQLDIFGEAGHVAYTDQFINPLPISSKIANALSEIALDNGSEYFVPSNLEITSIDTGNNSSNVVPNKVTMKFNIRFNTIQTVESLNDKVQGIIRHYTNNFELKYNNTAVPFIQDTNNHYFRLIKETIQKTTDIFPKFSTNGGTSDARFIHNYCPVVELGLLSHYAHKINERADVHEIEQLYKIYYNFLMEVFR